MEMETEVNLPFGKIYPVEPVFYDCSAQQMQQEGNCLIIKTVTTALVTKDTIYTPSLFQSCMNPEVVKAIPLEFEIYEKEKKIIIKQQESDIEICYDSERVSTRLWRGNLPKRGCENCTGCGRC